MGDEGKTSNPFITVAFIIVLIVLRGVAELTEYVVPIVAVIDILMLVYVFYTIDTRMKEMLGKRKDENKIFRNQYDEYNKLRKKIILICILAGSIYVLFLCIVKNASVVGGCINDCMAFITFGLSLEDDKIFCRLKEHYTSKDFSI